MSLYKEILLDHFKNPRFKDQGQILQPSFVVLESNPLCGDLLEIKGLVVTDKLAQAVFAGSGCVISQAVASLLLEKYTGCLVADILALTKEDMLTLVGMDLGPNRLKCALLALIALQKGLVHVRSL
jgi:nitrogen fixation protein NifU and related proteins